MLKNYILITLRNLAKNKIYSAINIIGFSIALVPVVLTFLYVSYEFSYDKYNENFDRIYRVVEDGKSYFGNRTLNPVMPNPLSAALKSEFPEIEYSSRMMVDIGHITYKEHDFDEENILVADPDFLKIFTFDFIEGNPGKVLNEPNSICFSETMAKKYFGDEDPIGRTVSFRNIYDVTVTGIYKDIPKNSHFNADFIIPASLIQGTVSYGSEAKIDQYNWGLSMFHTYFLLKKNAGIENVNKKYRNLIDKYAGKEWFPKSYLLSQPLKDIHLRSNPYSKAKMNEVDTIYLYLTVALILLIIACINYVNLTTARFSQRAKEISIRKIIGAEKRQLIRQLLTETFILTFVSSLLTIALTEILLSRFNAYVERDIHFSNGLLLGVIILIVIISLIAGIYPALKLSSGLPLSFFMGKSLTIKSSGFRNILIIIQFVLTVIFVFCSITVRKQLNFAVEQDLGFKRDNIIVSDLYERYSDSRLEALKTELCRYPGIVSASVSNNLPNLAFDAIKIHWPGDPEENAMIMRKYVIDYDFMDLFELKLLSGRGFSKEYTGDENRSVILNETAVKQLGWNNPIGKTIPHSIKNHLEYWTVIGVIKDTYNRSFHEPIQPAMLMMDSTYCRMMLSVKIKQGNISAILDHIETKLKAIQPSETFKYTFLEDDIKASYKDDYKLLNIFGLFSIFTVFISCLGLYGLISFTTEVRRKEIGIRKVLGASSLQIVGLLIREMIKLVFVSSIIAIPASYFLMHRWLADFAYRIDLDFSLFLSSALLVYAISLMAMIFQVLKASIRNPVDTLKYE